MDRFALFKGALFLALGLPVAILVWRFFTQDLGVDPVETLINETGEWGLRILLLGLLMSPLRRLLHKSWPLRLRRMLGLYGFFYVCLHLSIYIALDKAFYWDEVIADIIKRPYIMFGFAAFLMLIPLAVTSTRNWIRRLGRNWQRLHRLVYLIAAFALVHFLLLVKADITEPVIYTLLFLVLMLLRVEKRKT